MDVTIFADGEPCSRPLGKRLRKGRLVIALDGAAEQARKEGWIPDLVMGDFDTVSKRTLAVLESRGSKVIPTPDQSTTDLEKAVRHCLVRCRGLWVAQALGSRLDHSFTALSLLARYHRPNRDFTLWRDEEKVLLLKDEKRTLHGPAGRRISLLPFPACRVTARGLDYPLTHTFLKLGKRESVSNRATRSRITLEVEGSAVLVEAF